MTVRSGCDGQKEEREVHARDTPAAEADDRRYENSSIQESALLSRADSLQLSGVHTRRSEAHHSRPRLSHVGLPVGHLPPYFPILFAAAIAARTPDFSLIALIFARLAFGSGRSAAMYRPCC